jgi:death-on-curing protein
VERIDLADLLLIAEAATDTPVEQLQHVIDVALAESALGAPFAGFGDVEVHPETWQKIAALGYRLARYHSLPDGNKRTARVAMREFAMRNGFAWADPGEDEAVAVMEDAAAGSLSEEAFAVWVRRRLA